MFSLPQMCHVYGPVPYSHLDSIHLDRLQDDSRASGQSSFATSPSRLTCRIPGLHLVAPQPPPFYIEPCLGCSVDYGHTCSFATSPIKQGARTKTRSIVLGDPVHPEESQEPKRSRFVGLSWSSAFFGPCTIALVVTTWLYGEMGLQTA